MDTSVHFPWAHTDTEARLSLTSTPPPDPPPPGGGPGSGAGGPGVRSPLAPRQPPSYRSNGRLTPRLPWGLPGSAPRSSWPWEPGGGPLRSSVWDEARRTEARAEKRKERKEAGPPRPARSSCQPRRSPAPRTCSSPGPRSEGPASTPLAPRRGFVFSFTNSCNDPSLLPSLFRFTLLCLTS